MPPRRPGAQKQATAAAKGGAAGAHGAARQPAAEGQPTLGEAGASSKAAQEEGEGEELPVWADMGEAQHAAAATLGWGSAAWDASLLEDAEVEHPAAYSRAWGQLGGTERAAAELLGYDEEAWEGERGSEEEDDGEEGDD